MGSQRKKSETKKKTSPESDKEGGEFIRQPVGIKTEEIRRIAEPLCESEGMELVHVEYQREPGGRVLRLYIDKPGGVTLNDCVHISRQLNDLLDVCISMPDVRYSLEVSSPGLNRPLGKETDYEKFKGNIAKIRTIQPIEGQKNFYGVLQGIAEGIVVIQINDKSVSIPFQEISKARLVNYSP